ncbi:MAG: terminase large subunit [Dehalococcoidia bacterium]|jgi:hypothetical protein
MSKNAQYKRDPIKFLEEHYYLPETMKRIKLQDWQKNYVLKPVFYDLNDKGLRKYNKVLIGHPKKGGKSAFAAGVGIYFLFCDEPFGEIIIASNSRDQASMIIYTKMRRSVMIDPELKAACSPMHKDKIEVQSTGSTARCIAANFETAAGLNPNFTVFDELWGMTDRKFYDELTVVPTRKNPMIFIVTYAGFQEDGLLWDLYSDGMEGPDLMDTGDPDVVVKRGRKDPKLFMMWSHKNLSGWVNDEYLDQQRASMPPDVFARLHENKWVSAGSRFITQEDVDAIHDTPWTIQVKPNTNRYLQYVVATDIGISHDRTARLVGHLDPVDNNLYIDNIRVWQGTEKNHVPLEEVEQDLVWCAETFKTSILVIDPWQAEYIIQRLKKYYNIKPFKFSTDILYLSQVLVNLIRNKKIKGYAEPMLDKELKNTIIKQTAQGWRVDHAGKNTNDIVITLGMVALETVRGAFSFVEIPGMNDFKSEPHFNDILKREF